MRPPVGTGGPPRPRRGRASARPTRGAPHWLCCPAQSGRAKSCQRVLHERPNVPDGKPVQRANKRAAGLAPIVTELRAAGITSKKGIAEALNERGIPTTRGPVAGITRKLGARMPA
jgi:hypothetical protein